MCLGGFKINPSSLHQALLSWAPGSGEWATTFCVATLKKLLLITITIEPKIPHQSRKNLTIFLKFRYIHSKLEVLAVGGTSTSLVWSVHIRFFFLSARSARTIAKRAKNKRSVDFFAPKRCLLAFPWCLHLLFITSALGIPILNYKLHQ